MEEFKTVDFHGESTFDMIQVLYFFRAFYEQLGIKFTAWVEETLDRCWSELKCEHDDVSNSPHSTFFVHPYNFYAGSGLLQRDYGFLRQDHGVFVFLRYSAYPDMRTVASKPIYADGRGVCQRMQNLTCCNRHHGNSRRLPRSACDGPGRTVPGMA